MKLTRRIIFWILVVSATGGLLYVGMRTKPVEVDIAEVTTGPLRITIDEDGETRVREPYVISAPLAGRLLRVDHLPGDRVSKDTELAVIDSGELDLLDLRTRAETEARVGAAEARIKQVESEIKIAESEVKKRERYVVRDKGRVRTNNISTPVLEDTKHSLLVAQGELSTATSSLEIAGFELDQARAALAHTISEKTANSDRHFVIHSPIDGVVLRTFQESQVVVPAGERILEIGEPGDLEIRIDVLSQDAVLIKPGQKVRIEHWGGDEHLTARIRRVEPSAFTKVSALGVDEQRVWVFADFDKEIELDKIGLGDAYRIEAGIVIWEKDSVVKVPSGALFRYGSGEWAVYLIRNQTAQLRKVKKGKDSGIESEVISGLEVGDRVILHPGERVEDGTLLKVSDE